MSEEPYYATVSTGLSGKVAAGPSIDDLLASAVELLCALVGYVPRFKKSTISILIDSLGLVMALPLDNKKKSDQNNGIFVL